MTKEPAVLRESSGRERSPGGRCASADDVASVVARDGAPFTEPVQLLHDTYRRMSRQSAARAEATQEPSVSICVLYGLIDAVAAAGVERDKFLVASGLSPSELASGDRRFPRSEMFRLCELAMELTGDPSLGLHWGERSTDSTFTPLSHLIAHSANLRSGFQTLSEFQQLLCDRLDCELIEEGDRAILRLAALPNASLRLRRFIVEMEAVGMYRLMRCFGAQVCPERVSFAYPTPEHRAEYTRIFGGLETFDQPFSGITFARSLMNAVPPHRDDDVRSALQAIASRRVLRMAKRTPYAVRVREQLVAQGPCVRTDMSQVAHALGLSVRSLRRRLEAEGETFNAVANEAAAIIAKQLLEDKQRTIQEAAYEMGFADASGFHRAFKRWTGQTPRAYLEGKPTAQMRSA